VQFGEIIERWTGWCPKKQMVQKASGTDFLWRETSMKTQISARSKTTGIAAIILVLVAALVGMRLEFNSMQSLDWLMSDPETVEGYQWLANNTEKDATVLAWWDYADGIEKIGNRGVVINEASRNIKNTIGGYVAPGKPWHKIEYALWYPFESEEKVRDVAEFFLSENVTSAKEIAQDYGADYVLAMSDDLGKYYPLVIASEGNFSDYVRRPTNLSTRVSDMRPYLKKQTIFTRMINGDNIDGFSKAFDNDKIRIYKLT
jgi:asparagine N-glycosylation enzyme membrane subunit Stt3